MTTALTRIAAACLLAGAAYGALAQSTASTTRATELRADKLPTAAVIAPLASGAAVRVIALEGGWVQVEQGGQIGWVRASALNLQAGSSAAANSETGRQATLAGVNSALTLGVRSMPPRSNRHALIITVSEYGDAQIPALPGVKHDRQSATQMAQAMQVPASNIKYLADKEATGDAIRKALQELNDQVQNGDRVYVHFSGHGTRYRDPSAEGCVEALLAHDGGIKGTITNKEMSSLLKPITSKTDKLFVMYDACHSGGVITANSIIRSRGITNDADEGTLRPKFSNITEDCGRPVNVKTRNLVVEQVATGALPQDVIHVSASRHDEISFDDSNKGGLATSFMRDCLLRDAKDLDGSGAISMDEIRQCAQQKINDRMKNDAQFKPHNIQLSGNNGFIPAWFSQTAPVMQSSPVVALAPAPAPLSAPAPVAVAPTPAPATQPVRPPAASPAATPVPAPAVIPAPAPAPTPAAAAPVAPPAPAQLTGESALRQMFDQRDAKRRVQVTLSKDKLKIGQDTLDMTVQSDRAGYVYVAMAGSDNKSVYMLFPNELDQNNQINAGQQLALPRPNWRVRAGGPEGRNHLLVFVSDAPRDLSQLTANAAAATKVGPFVSSLNDARGRTSLGALMSTGKSTSAECSSAATRRSNPVCSDAYGATMISLDEIK
jgi:Caspase domain/Domain of unknown function (DUF4384)/Bacterial SH3 domain